MHAWFGFPGLPVWVALSSEGHLLGGLPGPSFLDLVLFIAVGSCRHVAIGEAILLLLPSCHQRG
jgi:hypothetical protein